MKRLSDNHIDFDLTLTKKNLWNLPSPHLRETRRNRRYEIDEILAKGDYVVLRLPPYHCQYNLIEMIWGFCKTYYNKNIRSHPFKDKVSRLLKKALENCSSKMWSKSVGHYEKLIKND